MISADPEGSQTYVGDEHEEYDDIRYPSAGSLVWAGDGIYRQTCRLHQPCTEIKFSKVNHLQQNLQEIESWTSGIAVHAYYYANM